MTIEDMEIDKQVLQPEKRLPQLQHYVVTGSFLGLRVRLIQVLYNEMYFTLLLLYFYYYRSLNQHKLSNLHAQCISGTKIGFNYHSNFE